MTPLFIHVHHLLPAMVFGNIALFSLSFFDIPYTLTTTFQLKNLIRMHVVQDINQNNVLLNRKLGSSNAGSYQC